MLTVNAYGPTVTEPLVLLHGFPFDSRMWADVLAAMPRVGVLTMDAPGFGRSAPIDGGLEDYADAVAETLTARGVQRAVVAGLSMGGYVALALAERHPDRLAGIGLLDTKAQADPEPARQNRLRVADAALGPEGAAAVAPMIDVLTAPGAPAQVRATVTRWLEEAPPSGIAWGQRAMAARPDRLNVLDGLDIPGLVLRGSDDATASVADHEAMSRALGTDVVQVAGAGHMSAVEAPGAVAEALSDLVARVRHTG
ncbi:Pimeloyl-ACP methyl ester carboxylesterase [Ruania alba]|uniref:Pimeloyl-ACP methyl ester carboxylesterase n=2 Tax=Ruania alba TaxID=648782 RepID=A0A1H5NGW6_9MICO|nr:Pimeloyl-ACP methyl ester carboxylesterase [Ruania alba]